MLQPKHGGNLAWAASLAGCEPVELLDFSASINPLGPPASAIVAIQSALPNLCHYPDPNYDSLRQALGEFHQVSPDWILPGNGAAELLTWAARDLAQYATTWVLTPGFGDYFRALQTFGAQVQPCPLPLDPTLGDRPLSALLAATSSATFSVGLLLNNPHNPTGRLFTCQELLPLLERCALVVLDEAFMDFLPPGQQQSLIDRVQEFPNLVIIRSLTKFYSLPGLRLGYAIAHPDRLHRWQIWRDPWSVNSLAVAAAEAIVQDVAFQQQTWHWLASARCELFEALAALPGLHPYLGHANFLLVRSDLSVSHVQRQLLKHYRILIRDCASFPELGDHFFRVAVKRQSENQRLIQALQEILG